MLTRKEIKKIIGNYTIKYEANAEKKVKHLMDLFRQSFNREERGMKITLEELIEKLAENGKSVKVTSIDEEGIHFKAIDCKEESK